LLSAPGFASGTAAYLLPIKVIIRSINSADEAGNFRVELLLSNRSQSDFELPISRDPARILRAGNKQRKTFLFKLQLTGLKAGQSRDVITETAISTSGSSSAKDSEFLLKQGESAVIAFNASLNSLKQPVQGLAEAEIIAICSEWTLDDERFYINAASHEVKSVNSVKLPLR
jgi:hypothetical protein